MEGLLQQPCSRLGRSAAHQYASTSSSFARNSLRAQTVGRAGRRAGRHALQQRVMATAEAEVATEEMSDEKRDIQQMLNKPYKYGFKTIIESDVFPKGLDEGVVRAISAVKDEPEWLLDFRCGSTRAGARSHRQPCAGCCGGGAVLVCDSGAIVAILLSGVITHEKRPALHECAEPQAC